MGNSTAALNSSPARWRQINNLFLTALDIETKRRREYVAGVCEDDTTLRVEVEWLLDNYERAGTFLERPVLQSLILRPLREISGQTLPDGTVLAERFKIERFIGGGGMGYVYQASDKYGDKPIALKVIRPDIAADPAITQLFYQEVNAAKSVAHRNVCRIHDTHVDLSPEGERTGFLTMELINGISLSERLKRHRRISSAELLGLAEQIADGLGEVHRCKVTHGDFKSGNILLESADGEVRPVITDFGLARLTTTKHLRSIVTGTSVIGTPAYMAPEQFEGVEPQPAADIYAFGLVLFEAVTGVQPFHGSLLEIRDQKLTGRIPVPREYQPQLSERWNMVLQKAMARHPQDRFGHVEEVVEALRAESPVFMGLTGAVPGETATATASASASRPFWRRRSVVIAAATLALATAVVFFSGHQPPAAAVRWFDEGMRAMRQGTYYRAMTAFDEATAIDPKFELAHARCAEAATYVEDSDKAKAELLKVTPPSIFRLPSRDQLRIEATYETINKQWTDAVRTYHILSWLTTNSEKTGVRLDTARVYDASGDTKEAERILKRAAAEDPENPAVAIRLGNLYRRLRRVTESEEQLKKAESFFRRANNQDGLTEVLYERGVLYSKNARPADAIPVLNLALASARQAGNRYREIKSLLELSYLNYVQGNAREGREMAETAMDLARNSGPDVLVAEALIDVAMTVMTGQEDLVTAEKYFRDGIEAAKRADAPRVRARGLINFSNLLRRENKYSEAVAASREAFAYYSQNHYRVEASQSMQSIVSGLIGEGKLEEAEHTLEPYISGKADAGDKGDRAMLEYLYAMVLAERQKYSEAFESYKRCSVAQAESGNAFRAGWFQASAAGAASMLGRFSDAGSLLQSAAEAANKADHNPRLTTLIQTIKAADAIVRLSWVEASHLLDEVNPRLADEDTRLDIQAMRCVSLVGRRQSALAREVCTGLPTTTVGLRASLHAEALLAAAEWELRFGSPERAAALAKQIHDESLPNGRFETQFKGAKILALSLERSGRTADAIRAATLAHDALDQEVSHLRPEFRASYLKRPDIESDVAAISGIH